MQYEAASSSETAGRVNDHCPSLFPGPLLFIKRHVTVEDQNVGHAFLPTFIKENGAVMQGGAVRCLQTG